MNLNEMRRVKSSNVRSVGFDPDPAECSILGTMYIEFVSGPGKVYRCSGVPVELYNDLLEQDTNPGGSVGGYFAKQIRPKYKFTVLE